MKGYSNYIFDLYGTLVDILTDEEDPRHHELCSAWYSEHGARYEPAEFRSEYLRLCAEEQSENPDPLYEFDIRRVFRSLYAEKGIEADPRLVEETAVFFRITSLKKLRLYPWVVPVFERIRRKGSGIYLLSNAQTAFTLPELRLLGLADSFDGIVISSEAGVRKPSPLIMRKLLERYDLDPAGAVMTGNDRLTDIACAGAFGMDSFYIRTATSGSGSLPGAKFELLDENYAELPHMLGLGE